MGFPTQTSYYLQLGDGNILRYVIKRLFLMVITFAIVITLVFVFIKSIPFTPPGNDLVDPEYLKMIMQREGYDKPILVQYGKWLENIFLYGSFGYSHLYSMDVADVLRRRIPVTVKINIIPYLISIPIGFGLGIWAALKKNKLSDILISFFVVLLISIPSFVIASVLQYLFAFKWNLVPQYIDTTGNFGSLAKSAFLPIFIMTISSVAGLTRVSRAELSEVLTSDFMLLCRTKGLTKFQSTTRHALRNSLVPLAPSLIGGFISILSGSLILEQIFKIEGIGQVYITAYNAKDYNLVMVVMVFYTFVGLLSTLIVDLSYGLIDPRIRMGEK